MSFLYERYPGAQQSPTQMIRMLGSPGMTPDKSLEAEAILNPEDKKKCKNGNMTETSKKCPDGFVRISNVTDIPWPCWHFAGLGNEMNYSAARDYCDNLFDDGEWHFLRVEKRLEWDILWNIYGYRY